MISPKNIGYASDAKQQYRDNVWSSFDKDILELCSQENNVFVLIFPSKEGIEIETAISYGIPENKIIAIDYNPAVIAVSKWRKDYPNVKFYGCMLSKLSEKLIKNQQLIGIANLDLCYNFSKNLIEETSAFFSCRHIFFKKSCIALTIAKGRESTETNYLLELVAGNNRKSISKRIDAFIKIVLNSNNTMTSNCGILLGNGAYLHSRVPMEWFSFSLYTGYMHEYIKDDYQELLLSANDLLSIDKEDRSKSNDWMARFNAAKNRLHDLNFEFKKNKMPELLFGIGSAYSFFGNDSIRICDALAIPNRRG